MSATYFGWQFADGIIRMLTGTPPVPTLTVERVFTKDDVSRPELDPGGLRDDGLVWVQRV